MATLRPSWTERFDRWRELTTLIIVAVGAFALPLVFLRDPTDMFRLPKAMFLRAEAILLVGVWAAGYIMGAPLPRPRWRDPWLILPLAALSVFVLAVLTSTNVSLSIGALGSAVATMVVFFATVSSARRHGWVLLTAPLAAAALNAVLVGVEELNLWMPFGVHSEMPHHLQCDALIGNPNEVGGYLGTALLSCLAFLWAHRGEERLPRWAMGVTVLLLSALLASRTLTAMIAFGVAALGMFALTSWKKALRAAGVAAAIAVMAVLLVAPFRARALNVLHWARTGEYNAILTERLTPFVASWSMFVDHPLTGVGPDAFHWQYYDYKIRAEQRNPGLRLAFNRGVNFGEVHNDHLQVLAEGGILGYLAFVALLGALAWISFSLPVYADEARQRFARRLALPLALFWIVLSIAQFPLESTVVRSLLIHLAALCVGWRES
jgi:O-antigen ligase